MKPKSRSGAMGAAFLTMQASDQRTVAHIVS
jgi:hypothetical protein